LVYKIQFFLLFNTSVILCFLYWGSCTDWLFRVRGAEEHIWSNRRLQKLSY